MKTVKIPAIGQEYAIGKIVCLGRNYAEHARELGNEVPSAPVIFMKPATAAIADGGTVRIPVWSQACHHEVELALLIGREARGISPERAMDCVAGFGVAIDMTLRDVQDQLKSKGLPWEIAKGFDTSCPLSDFVPAPGVPDPHDLTIRLWVNGQQRQNGTTAAMIHRVPQIVAHISSIFTLEPGDVILTGTPSGVGPVRAGDVMEAEIASVGRLRIFVE